VLCRDDASLLLFGTIKGKSSVGAIMAEKWRRAWSINRSSSLFFYSTLYVCHYSHISLPSSAIFFSIVARFDLISPPLFDKGSTLYIGHILENDNSESVARWLANFFTIKRAHWISCGRRGDEKPNAFYTFLISRPCPIWFFLLAVLSHHLNICRYFYM
jgi:hypothetical protein